MRNSISHILLIIWLLPLSSCDKLFFDDLEKTTIKILNFSSFKTIKVHDSFNIVLKQDSIYSVSIEAPVESMGNIKCYLDSDTLRLRDGNSKYLFPSYVTPTAYISFPNIDSFRMRAPGDIETEGTIKQDRISFIIFKHNGKVKMDFEVKSLSLVTGQERSSGDYLISGKADKAHFWMRSSCQLNALDLRTSELRMINNSFSDCYINVTDKLTAVLNLYGSIYYKGSPEITIEEQIGKGKLIALD